MQVPGPARPIEGDRGRPSPRSWSPNRTSACRSTSRANCAYWARPSV